MVLSVGAPGRRSSLRFLVPAVAIAVVVMGCIQLKAPHENFKAIMGRRVGENIEDLRARKNGAVNPKYLLSVKEVGGGHKELEYQYRGACRYYFEVNASGTIVGWRYMGPESDCIIVP